MTALTNIRNQTITLQQTLAPELGINDIGISSLWTSTVASIGRDLTRPALHDCARKGVRVLRATMGALRCGRRVRRMCGHEETGRFLALIGTHGLHHSQIPKDDGDHLHVGREAPILRLDRTDGRA